MKHKNIRKKLLLYLESELPEKEKREIQLHLKHCEICRKDIEKLSGVWALQQTVKRVQPPEFLWSKISERLNKKSQAEYFNYRITSLVNQIKQPALIMFLIFAALFIGIRIGGSLVNEKPLKQQNYISSNQLESEFGLDNFQILSSGSLGGKMVELMSYEKK